MVSSEKRVLIIEDESEVSALIAGMLEELGYQVVVGGCDLKGAAESARTAQVDVAVLDLAIEDGNTFAVAPILHERGIPFLFMTGLDVSKTRDKFGPLILQKPFGAQRLQDAIRSLEKLRRP